MAAVTTHRGPDDEGWHVDGPCAIGMRRLSIIDPAGGHQPISSADDTLWVVCNGEIYNFKELRIELQQAGYVFKTASDTEVIIHAYARYGDGFVSRLSGMFGFALWDGKRRRLILGRDRLGIKPLYCFNDGRRFIFASEAKAILALPWVSTELDSAALGSYLRLGYVASPRSIFRGVGKIPPASITIVEKGEVVSQTYWTLPHAVDRSVTEDEWVERLRITMTQAVRKQMVSDVPLGAFLSGGIDSGAVVAFMAANSGQPVKTYSIGFSGGPADEFYNELPYAKRLAQHFGTDHREIVVRPDLIALLPHLLWHMDEPIGDSAFLTTYLVAHFARHDVTVILSGVGGDELLGGYRRYLGNLYVGRFNRLSPPIRRLLRRFGQMIPSDRHSSLLNTLRYAKGFLATAELPFEERYLSYVQALSEEKARSLRTEDRYIEEDAVTVAMRGARSDDALNRLLFVDVNTQLPDDLLLLTDKMTMATSLECRVPLLDDDLVELAARIPESLKLRGGNLKYLMKRALRGVLPDDILHRPKRGFGAPMGAWLKKELKDVFDYVLSDEAIKRRGLLRPQIVRQLMDDHINSREDYTDQLLSLFNFELWSRIYLDKRSPDDLVAELKAVA